MKIRGKPSKTKNLKVLSLRKNHLLLTAKIALWEKVIKFLPQQQIHNYEKVLNKDLLTKNMLTAILSLQERLSHNGYSDASNLSY